MSSEERRKILQMVADGKISAEEAAGLMRALDEDAGEEDSAGEQIEVLQAESGFGPEQTEAPEFDEVRRRAFRFAMIPLWIGVIVTVLSAWGMYSVQMGAGLNFWFFCLTLPLLFGVLLIALGAGGRASRWIYVNVDRSHQNEWPRKITLALPIPLGLVSWFLKNFGSRIDGLKKTTVDDVLMAISMTKSVTEPLIVHVNDDNSGDRVQVFIG
ncbi:MAG TPA: hypothetical protein PKE35_15660 [Anaerolineales bacterium]|nr:hypothetical protein [Anaerolineales bacterium]HNB87425.1 hypothetical protein [Anaerolineales bacterium]HNE69663.1 hypothetical protein [Anaerolineales bacterium]HNF35482.1 hypothetical protein [Anaerolineales bacterium]HNH05941.1 hypothetical protein [Anaerolineales bacterium]